MPQIEFIFVVASVIGSAVVFVLFLLSREERIFRRLLVLLSLLSASLGYILFYLQGTSEGIEQTMVVSVRSFFCVIGMFTGSGSIWWELQEEVWPLGEIWYILFLWVCHVMAMAVTFSLILATFFHQGRDMLRGRLRRYQELILFFGAEERTLLLGSNIAYEDGKRRYPHPKSLLVYLDQSISPDTEQQILAMGALPVIYRENTLLQVLQKIGFFSTPFRVAQKQVIVAEGLPAQMVTLVQNIVEQALTRQVRDDCLSILLLSESSWIFSFAERLSFASGYNVRAFSEAALAGRQLMRTLPLYQCLSFDEQGVATRSTLSVVVVGYGTTGLETVRRLAIHGQFPGCRLRVFLVDKEMEERRSKAQRLFPSLYLSCRMEYHQVDVEKEEFWEWMDQWAVQMDYLVLATESDEKNMELAEAVMAYFQREDWPLPFMAIGQKEGRLDPLDAAGRVVFFSQKAAIYTKAVIIDEEEDHRAAIVDRVWQDMFPKEQRHRDFAPWEKLDEFSREEARSFADCFPAVLYCTHTSEEDAAAVSVLHGDGVLQDTVVQMEHLRKNAFYHTMGYRPMSVPEMEERANRLMLRREDVTQCYVDDGKKRYAALVHWEDLDALSESYNRLMEDHFLEDRKDFQMECRQVLSTLPRILREERKQ